MKRPRGVTVIACIFLFMAFAAVNGMVTFPSFWTQSWGRLSLWAVNLSIALILGLALLRMQNWSRWTSILASAAFLLFIPREVTLAHSSIDMIRAGVRTLVFVWVIWYLSRPEVKAAFQSTWG